MTKRVKEGKDLQSLLGYQLQMANLQVTEEARKSLGAFGVSPAKLAALILIRDNAGCEQSALGRALAINRSSAMKLVNALADLGLVERRPGRDLRSNALHLTDTGNRKLSQMLSALRESDRRIGAHLSAAEQNTLLRLLRTLRAPTRPSGS